MTQCKVKNVAGAHHIGVPVVSLHAPSLALCLPCRENHDSVSFMEKLRHRGGGREEPTC